MRTALLLLILLTNASAWAAIECRKTGEECAAPNETRLVNGMSVFRECWEYQDTYECLAPGVTEDAYCDELRARGCSQVGSQCITESDFGCMTYEQTYECPSDQPPAEQAVLDCGGQLFCLEGNCFETGYQANGNMGRVGALLSVLEAVSDELSVDTMEVFRGEDRRCGISITDAIGAQNCCRISGWAEGTFSCSFEEELLADMRQAGRCHYVGTYCSNETFLGICTVNTQTHCCFGSKLSRIIAEQGRPQLGKGWGSAKSPDCSGFTMDEVASLDFEAMDLSEFYADVLASMHTINSGEMQERMTGRMNQLLP